MTLSTAEGELLEVNDAFVATTGYDAATLSRDEDAGAAVDRSARLRPRHGLAGAGRQRAQPGNGAAHARGALLDCLLSAAPVKIQDLPCVLGAIQDITERKRNELELMEAIETVMQDTSWFSRTVIEKLAQIRAPGAPQSQGELADLTRREREILGLICDGHTDAEIAATLHLSRNTVRNHVAALYGKLDVHRRSAAIIWARSAASWATRNRRASARGRAWRGQAARAPSIKQVEKYQSIWCVRFLRARAAIPILGSSAATACKPPGARFPATGTQGATPWTTTASKAPPRK